MFKSLLSPLLCMMPYLNYCQHRCTAVTASTEAPPTYYLSLILARGNKTTIVTSSGRRIHRFRKYGANLIMIIMHTGGVNQYLSNFFAVKCHL